MARSNTPINLEKKWIGGGCVTVALIGHEIIKPEKNPISIARADGPMTAVIYFGEMLVASLLAIVLLAISPLRMSSDAVLFGGGVVAWTFAEYVVHRFVLHGFAPTEHRLHHASPDEASSQFFGKYGSVSRWSI
jgi:hypothetical protein